MHWIIISFTVCTVVAYQYCNQDSTTHQTGKKDLLKCHPRLGLRPLRDRGDMGSLLEEYGLKTGVEVGVKLGQFSREVLSKWKSCQSYKLVDPWEHQKNYNDAANVNQQAQNDNFEKTKVALRQWDNITEFYRMYSIQAAKQMKEESLDFVYIDARHDYCAMTEDLLAYWPLVAPGGILAGHDYMSSPEVRSIGHKPDNDWSLCSDGTRHEGAVKGAVEEFLLPKGLTITVTYWRQKGYFTWLVQKPMC